MYVYAYYNKENKPLYIGQAEDVLKRYEEHKCSDKWMNDVDKIIVHGPYPSNDDLSYFEKYYVRKEQPLYNKNLMKMCNYKEINDPYQMVVFKDFTEMKDYYYQSSEQLKRATYYLRIDQLETLSLICYEDAEDKSKLVRKLLDEAIDSIGRAKKRDYKAEAEERMKMRG